MKQLIYMFAVLFVCTNCNGQTKEKNPAKSMTINDPESQYDQGFIDGLGALFEKPFTLTNTYILVEKDTIYPPEELPLNKEIVLHGVDNHLLMTGKADYSKEQFFLSLTRTNYTNIAYKLARIVADTIVSGEKEGVAILSNGPVLSSEDEAEHPNRLYFFPKFEDYSDSCAYEFMYEGLNDHRKLTFNLRIFCADKKSGEPYSERSISFSGVFYKDEK